MKVFQENIIELRKRNNLTQKAVANALGITQPSRGFPAAELLQVQELHDPQLRERV